MKVYILTDYQNKKRLELLKKRCLSNGFEIELVSKIGNLNIEKNVIISTNVPFQFDIFKKYCTKNIYCLLDDKIKFYDYLKENSDLLKGIKIIPTYDKSYSGPNITKKFLVKDKDGCSSKFNQIIHGSIYDLINKYSHQHQVQEIIDVKHIYGISCSCAFGKILGIYTYKTNGHITPECYINGFDEKCGNFVDIPAVRKFLKKICNRIKYNGIVEMEFIIDKNDKVYIMECNPRISGSITSECYFEWVIIPYLKCLHSHKTIEINMEDKSLWKDE
jgi:predicted ATP-grasp superfamily ATP-dependent carboligase